MDRITSLLAPLLGSPDSSIAHPATGKCQTRTSLLARFNMLRMGGDEMSAETTGVASE